MGLGHTGFWYFSINFLSEKCISPTFGVGKIKFVPLLAFPGKILPTLMAHGKLMLINLALRAS